MDQIGSSPFTQRGVVEGFYGLYYTVPQRIDLIRFLGRHGFNRYVYGPKDDRHHRLYWREPYPARAMDDFARMIEAAAQAGVTFIYALSPGLSIRYSDPTELDHIVRKLGAFHALGVRHFSLFLDDIQEQFQHPADAAAFSRYGAAHADICNRTYARLKALDPVCTLSMCPTHYYGGPPFNPYLSDLGTALDPDIAVFYTGREVCSPTLTAEDARQFGAAISRPPIIWDNYPVNDTIMEPELHIGPLRGRGPDLAGAVGGMFVNLALQPEASKVALLTWAEYLSNPAGYDPDAAWTRALAAVAGDEDAPALRRVAENSLFSCLQTDGAPVLAALTQSALAALQGGEGASNSAAVAALRAYLASLDEAVYHLRHRARNLALRNDLLPWLEQLENWVRVGVHALALLEAPAGSPVAEGARQSLSQALAAAQSHRKRIADQVLLPLAEFALAR